MKAYFFLKGVGPR